MKKVLYINANPQKEQLSFSRRAGKHYLEKLRKGDHNVDIDIINLYEEDIQLIDEDVTSILLEGVAIPGKTEEEKLGEFLKQVDDLLEPELV